MNKRTKILLLVLMVTSFISCGSSQKNNSASTTNETANKITGTYEGVIPCADCEGINYTLQLNKDLTYTKSLVYKGKSTNAITESGSFLISKNEIIQLDEKAAPMNLLKIIDGGLLLLDKNGQVIEGSLANNYKLKPASTVTENSENKGMQEFLMKKQQDGIDFYAIGNEPFWSLDMDFDKVIRFKTLDGVEFNAPAVEPTLAQDHNVKRYRAVTESGEIIIQIIQGECNDTMSDQKYPYQVTIAYKTTSETDYTNLEGCGMYVPDFRLHTIWAIDKVDGVQINVSDYTNNAPKLEVFVSEQRVLGSDGCNSFRGKMYNEENRLYFGPMASTMMACLHNAEISHKINSAFSKKRLTYTIDNNLLTIFENNVEIMVLKHID